MGVNKKIRIAIKVDGGKNIGLGHYYRCLSLADAFLLCCKNIEIIFLINGELEKFLVNTNYNHEVFACSKDELDYVRGNLLDLFILDSYKKNDDYLRHIRSYTNLMLIDDNNDIYDMMVPDVIYNGNIYAEELEYPEIEGQLKLIGTKYLIMRKEYWDTKRSEDEKYDLLITTGGSDRNRICKMFLRKLQNLKDIRIVVIIGSNYQEEYVDELIRYKTDNIQYIYRPSGLKKYIEQSRLLLTSTGSTVYEGITLNKDLIIYSSVENQNRLYDKLIEKGINGIGKYPNIDISKLEDIIREELKNDKTYGIQIDGKSTFRLAEVILEFLNKVS